jgi:hypothetical protein
MATCADDKKVQNKSAIYGNGKREYQEGLRE